MFLPSLFLFLVGASLGSFICLAGYREKRRMSLWIPFSQCDYCGEKIKWYRMIPIVGYFFTRRKCPYCNMKISVTYPMAETLFGVVFVYLFAITENMVSFLWYAVFFVLIAIPAEIDRRTYEIPDRYLFSIGAVGLMHTVLGGSFWESAISFVIATCFMGAIYFIFRGAMGSGDIFYSTAISFWLNPHQTVTFLFLSFFLGGIAGIILLFMGKKHQYAVPFAPFLAAGAVISYGCSDWIWNVYETFW